MGKIKDNFLKQYLPMWAKECVLAENLQLRKKVAKLERENDLLKAYIKGLKLGMESTYKQLLTNADRCVSCGAIIPEGTLVCTNCNGEKEG